MGNLFVILLFRVPLVARLVTMFLSLKFVAFLCCLGLRLVRWRCGCYEMFVGGADEFFASPRRARFLGVWKAVAMLGVLIA